MTDDSTRHLKSNDASSDWVRKIAFAVRDLVHEHGVELGCDHLSFDDDVLGPELLRDGPTRVVRLTADHDVEVPAGRHRLPHQRSERRCQEPGPVMGRDEEGRQLRSNLLRFGPISSSFIHGDPLRIAVAHRVPPGALGPRG